MSSIRRKVHTAIDYADTLMLLLACAGIVFMAVMVCYSIYLVFWY